MTREQLDTKIANIQQQRDQALAHFHACDGALQILKELRQEDAAAPVESGTVLPFATGTDDAG